MPAITVFLFCWASTLAQRNQEPLPWLEEEEREL